MSPKIGPPASHMSRSRSGALSPFEPLLRPCNVKGPFHNTAKFLMKGSF